MKTPKSLKVRLLRNLMFTLSLAWLVTIGIGYILTQRTLNQQLDAQLEWIAQTLAKVAVTETTVDIHGSESILGHDGKRVEFQIWRKDKIVSYSVNAPRESLSQNEGYSQNEIDNKRWRVFSARNADSRVVVGEDLDVRKALVHTMILSSLWPMVVALPLIALILWFSVSIGLAPLVKLASAIKKRTPEKLEKIDLEGIPSEVIPVVQSLNELLEVVDRALERERQFSDNAAHELRTPLTAIKTHAQVALRSQSEHEKSESIQAINLGVDRATRMVNQLLTLARLDPEHLQISFSSLDLKAIVSKVIAEFAPLALAKNIDIGLSESTQIFVKGNQNYLEILIANLVDNAIRYTPQGGKIDLQLEQSNTTGILSIEDNGSGIPEKDRERVFNRFVRLSGGDTEGSGIGLAIVQKIVNLHKALIELDSPKEHQGLIVKVIFNRIIDV